MLGYIQGVFTVFGLGLVIDEAHTHSRGSEIGCTPSVLF